MIKIAIISDVHGKWNQIKIPEVDILISCGDYSFKGEPHMVKDFHAWLNKQEAGHIISVQGNHELWVEKNFNEAKAIAEEACPAVYFMEEGPVEVEGIRVWCSAWTPWFWDWAYNADRGANIAGHWSLIPDEVDVLVTHGPPAGILDIVRYADGTPKERVGCMDLLDRIQQLDNLKMHCFGHIHSSHGRETVNGVHYINASICGETYAADYEPEIYLYEENK